MNLPYLFQNVLPSLVMTAASDEENYQDKSRHATVHMRSVVLTDADQSVRLHQALWFCGKELRTTDSATPHA